MEHRKLSEISLFQLFHFTRNIASKNGFVYFPRHPPYLFALNEHPKLSRSPWRVLLLRATIVTASGLSWRRRSKWMGRLIETAANKLVDRRGLISWPKLLARRYGCLGLFQRKFSFRKISQEIFNRQIYFRRNHRSNEIPVLAGRILITKKR